MGIMRSVFKIEKGEGSLVFVLGFALMVNALAMQISGIVAISGFLQSGGVNQILVVLFIDYALILGAGAVQSLFIDKYDRINLIQWLTILFALIFVVLRLMFLFQAPEALNYSIMYILAEQQYVLFPLIFWVLANDIFKISQAKRLFPLISGWSFFGKLIGIGVAAFSPSIFLKLNIKPEEILTVNIFVYLLAYFVLMIGLQNVSIRKTNRQIETVKETLTEGWEFVKNVPSFKFMMVAIFGLAVADTIIEFRFLVLTDSVFTDQASFQRFFSLYRLGTTLLALGLQALVTSYLIKQMKLQNTFLIFPFVALIGIVGLLMLPGASVAIIVMVAVKLVRDTINESSRKSFQGLIPEERRGRVSTMMESYFPALGTMLACVLAGGVVYYGVSLNLDLSALYLSIAGAGAAIGFWAIAKLLKVYDASLFNWRLKRRQRNADSILLKRLED